MTIDINSILTAVLPVLAYALANAIGNGIPDSATGPLGILRQIAKFVALNIPNKA